MTAPDHTITPLKNFLRERGHPYMKSNAWFRRHGTAQAVTVRPLLAPKETLRSKWVAIQRPAFANIPRLAHAIEEDGRRTLRLMSPWKLRPSPFCVIRRRMALT